jgi:preprotein translocase subunit YajC
MDLSVLFPFIILLLFIPIFLSGRRQRRQMQEMQRLQRSLSDGDVVVTTSGLRGTVVDASYEETIDLEIAPGVVTTWLRAAVREKAAGAEQAPGGTASDSSADSSTESSADAAQTPASAESTASASDSAASASTESAKDRSTS